MWVLLAALASDGCAARHRDPARILEAPPRALRFEAQLRAYLDTTPIGDVPLGTYLETAEIEGCLVADEGPLLDGLDGLRRLHRRAYERSDSAGRLRVWEIWRARLRRFTPDGRALVEIYLDQPARGRRFFFCDDGLPVAWRELDVDGYRSRATTYFLAEIEARRAAIEAGGGDGALQIEQLRELRDAIERRAAAQFDERGDDGEAVAALSAALDDLWYVHVDEHDLGMPVAITAGRAVAPHVAEPPPEEGLPATYSDHPAAAMSGAGGWGAPPREGFAIPDPADVARRDRLVRSWQQQRRILVRDARQTLRLAAELEAQLAETTDPEQRERLLRELRRADNRLDHISGDLGRHQEHVGAKRSGHAVTDALLGRARRKEVKRSWRGTRRVDDVQREMRTVVERTEAAAGDAAGVGTDALADGGAGAGDGGGGADRPPAGATGDPDATGAGDPAAATVEEVGDGALVYRGPCPPPEVAWSDGTVSALREAYPFVDEVDARIFLTLLHRTYAELGERARVEAVVRSHLESGLDLQLDEGGAGGLSDVYDPDRRPDEQDEITFYVRLEL